MSLTNCYCTVADLDAVLPDQMVATDVTLKEAAISSACRRIDRYTGGRQFWKDTSTSVRYYYPDSPTVCEVDDFWDTASLVVAVDMQGLGAYDVTLTRNTDFIVAPENADTDYPVRPWSELRIVYPTTNFFPAWGHRPGVKVTAKFGWPAVPDDLKQAAVIQSQMLYMVRQSTFGDVSFAGGGGMRLRNGLHPMAADLADGYRLPAVG